jgi:hypothetical protein
MIFFSKKTTANIYSPKEEKIEWLKMKNIQKKKFTKNSPLSTCRATFFVIFAKAQLLIF